jgi:hypothetical protein
VQCNGLIKVLSVIFSVELSAFYWFSQLGNVRTCHLLYVQRPDLHLLNYYFFLAGGKQ